MGETEPGAQMWMGNFSAHRRIVFFKGIFGKAAR
jgi:hypothetical protein